MIISIHVPAWGTTMVTQEGDIVTYISIHVPAWGTTKLTHHHLLMFHVFQSTFPRGERRPVPPISTNAGLFQSTFPRGERPDHEQHFSGA